jgi:DNA-directed RNA polymerase sigma subunit (sigma70/sigma32)
MKAAYHTEIPAFVHDHPDLLDRLTPREARIARALAAGCTLDQAGLPLGITRERVRQIAVWKITPKIRALLAGKEHT